MGNSFLGNKNSQLHVLFPILNLIPNTAKLYMYIYLFKNFSTICNTIVTIEKYMLSLKISLFYIYKNYFSWKDDSEDKAPDVQV